jgi:hypothetical protein
MRCYKGVALPPVSGLNPRSQDRIYADGPSAEESSLALVMARRAALGRVLRETESCSCFGSLTRLPQVLLP